MLFYHLSKLPRLTDLPAHRHGRWRNYTPSMCVRPCSQDGGHWVGCKGGSRRASLVVWRATPSCAAGERWWCLLWGPQQCPPTPRSPPTPVVSPCQRRNWSPRSQRYPEEGEEGVVCECVCVVKGRGGGEGLPLLNRVDCPKHSWYVTAPYIVVPVRLINTHIHYASISTKFQQVNTMLTCYITTESGLIQTIFSIKLHVWQPCTVQRLLIRTHYKVWSAVLLNCH